MYALFVQTAMLYDSVLRDGSVHREHVLAVDVDVREEQLLKLVETASRAFVQRVVFVEVEEHYVAEAHSLVLVFADEGGEEVAQRSTGADGNRAEFPFPLAVLDFGHNFVRNLFRAFFDAFEDVRGSFLQPCQDGTVYGVLRPVVARRNAVQ